MKDGEKGINEITEDSISSLRTCKNGPIITISGEAGVSQISSITSPVRTRLWKKDMDENQLSQWSSGTDKVSLGGVVPTNTGLKGAQSGNKSTGADTPSLTRAQPSQLLMNNIHNVDAHISAECSVKAPRVQHIGPTQEMENLGLSGNLDSETTHRDDPLKKEHIFESKIEHESDHLLSDVGEA